MSRRPAGLWYPSILQDTLAPGSRTTGSVRHARGSSADAECSLAIINAASAFGRITPLIAARWVGFINIHATFAITSAIMLFVWTTAKSVPGVLVYDAMYGISSGEWPRGRVGLVGLWGLVWSQGGGDVRTVRVPDRGIARLIAFSRPSADSRVGAYAAAFNAAAASFSPHPNQVG